MARKPLSAINWAQRSIDEIFADPISEIEAQDSKKNINVHEKIEHFERKINVNFHKNRPAPLPPGTKISLPKIGNYKPKILLSREPSKVSVAPKSPYNDIQVVENENTNKDSDQKNVSQFREREKEPIPHVELESVCNMQSEDNIYSTIESHPDYNDSSKTNVMIIGDKDVPLILDGYQEADDQKELIDNSSEQGLNKSEDNLAFTDLDAVVNIGESVVNPLFEEQEKPNEAETSAETPRHTYKKRRAPGVPSSYISRHRHNSHSSHASDEEYPYIPEPDYEEDEATINFADDFEKENQIEPHPRNNRKVVKEYEGEDFSKYMEDDDDGFHEQYMYTWRKNIKHPRKQPTKQPKKSSFSKSKHSTPIQSAQPKLKQMRKAKHNEPEPGGGSMLSRHTLKSLSYADSKMGLDDRTVRSVKSTSSGGRYVKRGKERTMIVDGDSGGGGYEEFLKMRHKEEGSLESNSSGDSGLDDMYTHDAFHKMQPKNVRDKKGLWEKLTWRFKRHVGDYRMS